MSSMNILGVELDSSTLLAILAVLLLGFLTAVSLLKFYAYVTCGFFHEKVRMEGKTVIVTGATGGIGKETARELAKRGAKVIIACRNVESAKKVRDELAEDTKNQNIIVKKLDLSSQKSIREFAEDINRTESRLDVLVHNAGTAENKLKKSEDGIELTMATNHFGPFLLTHLLIDLLKRSAPSRIVVVASELYRLASLNLDNLNPSSTWCPEYWYYVSKYANICFTLELARRLEGTGVTVNCLHPGMIDSGIWRNVPIPLSWGLKLIIKCFFKTPKQGCQTSVFLACSEEVKNVSGRYFRDCSEKSLSSGARDVSKARKLWELSETFVNLRNDDPKL
ncbi:retinol dehydrogenase 14 isoform X2 [Diabrotica undecimpunctata]|uniref:retinol dehydrogenase 14 isoform X2 n=1 Tax=Diabrotica undecimpunctata TaxID=50387 RepID=UPI003B63AC99